MRGTWVVSTTKDSNFNKSVMVRKYFVNAVKGRIYTVVKVTDCQMCVFCARVSDIWYVRALMLTCGTGNLTVG